MSPKASFCVKLEKRANFQILNILNSCSLTAQFSFTQDLLYGHYQSGGETWGERKEGNLDHFSQVLNTLNMVVSSENVRFFPIFSFILSDKLKCHDCLQFSEFSVLDHCIKFLFPYSPVHNASGSASTLYL